jgi:sulfur relay (sulfurtransferase) DsrC/TusE family protein
MQEQNNGNSEGEISITDFLITMKKFFENINKEHKELLEDIEQMQLEQEDLLHEIELSNLNASEIAKVMKRLKELRKNRRIFKNDLEVLNLVKNFTDKYNNKFITNEIVMLIKEINKKREQQENRKYKPRVLTDLKVGRENENENLSNRPTEM